MIESERRVIQDWEWRDAEYERRRRRARMLARRRGRMRLAALVMLFAAVAALAYFAARAVSLPTPCARAAPAVTREEMPATVPLSVTDGALSWAETVLMTQVDPLDRLITGAAMDLAAQRMTRGPTSSSTATRCSSA